MKLCFYSTPFWGRVYKWKFCLFICLSVHLSVITSYSFPFSDSKLTQPPPVNLNHATSPTVSNFPHPCLPCTGITGNGNSRSPLHATSPVDLNHATSPKVSNVPHPCLPCPPVNWPPFPVNWSPNEQDHISNWGRVMCQLDISLQSF